jgi:hypothetical protein
VCVVGLLNAPTLLLACVDVAVRGTEAHTVVVAVVRRTARPTMHEHTVTASSPRCDVQRGRRGPALPPRRRAGNLSHAHLMPHTLLAAIYILYMKAQ